MQTITIFTDGGARGNPGPAGIGVVVYDMNNPEHELATLSEYIGETTNNVAEYTALLRAFETLPTLVVDPALTTVTVKLDSQLVERQLIGAYKVKDATLKTYFEKIKPLLAAYKKVEFQYIPREQNKRADKLANEAMDKKA